MHEQWKTRQWQAKIKIRCHADNTASVNDTAKSVLTVTPAFNGHLTDAASLFLAFVNTFPKRKNTKKNSVLYCY
jgi:hypothetical protein